MRLLHINNIICLFFFRNYSPGKYSSILLKNVVKSEIKIFNMQFSNGISCIIDLCVETL